MKAIGSRIKAVAFYTVDSGNSAPWLFWKSEGSQARVLFTALCGRTRINDTGDEYEDNDTVNLIAWDRHPSQEGALGFIIDQYNPGSESE